MRLFFWPLAITIILLCSFSQIITLPTKSTYQLPIHKTLYVHRQIYDEELLYLIQATIEWSEATNNKVIFDIRKLPVKDIDIIDSIIVMNVTSDDPGIILLDSIKQKKNRKTLAYYNNDTGLAYIALVDERLNKYNYIQVIMHELGHAIGLKHLEDTDENASSLMHPTINYGTTYITKLDLIELCKLYHCNIEAFVKNDKP